MEIKSPTAKYSDRWVFDFDVTLDGSNSLFV